MPEALRRIKEELGADAVILSTRHVKRGKGAFGMLGRPILEVTAAADVAHAPRTPSPNRLPVAETATTESPSSKPDHGAFLALQADLDSLREELALVNWRPPARTPDFLTRDVKALVGKVDRLVEQTARFDRLKLAPGLRRLQTHLEAVDLEPGLAARIAAFLQEKADAGVLAEGGEASAFRQVIERTLQVSGSLVCAGSGPKVVALVGPTGVGKTTTVAKLAALGALQVGVRVGLITVDTFRIAAVEQLKTYGRIIGVPTLVALDAAAFRRAVEDLADRDLVLVDTAGQSPRDEEGLAELLRIFPEEVDVEVHLVLSVTTRTRDLERILRRYASVRASSLLLTKLDETQCHGPILGLPLVSRLPVSYLTTGQNVPDDIQEATPRAVADFLLAGFEAQP
jgi:flagellar biosynthesis protein FlhF